MSDLLQLAERCEQATGPDRELDAAICAAAAPICLADYVSEARPSDNCVGMVVRYFEDGAHGTFVSDRYTASVDAALTLVPEGWSFEVMRGWRCDIKEGLASAFVADKQFGPPTVHQHSDNAATPALALCAAALRGRAEQEQSS